KKPKVIAWFFFEGNDFYDDASFEWQLSLLGRGKLNELWASLTRYNWKQRSFTINAFRFIRVWSDPIVPNRAPFWALLPGQSGSSQRIYFSGYGAVPWTEYEES